mgnify:CR=1 FL=1
MPALNPYSKTTNLKHIRDFLRASSPFPHKKSSQENPLNQSFPGSVEFGLVLELTEVGDHTSAAPGFPRCADVSSVQDQPIHPIADFQHSVHEAQTLQ